MTEHIHMTDEEIARHNLCKAKDALNESRRHLSSDSWELPWVFRAIADIDCALEGSV